MNNSVKAILLSTLLYPGSGHFFLKKQIKGCIFAALFSLPLLLLFSEIINKTNQIIAQIESGNIPLDIIAISKALTEITSDSTVHIYLMGAVWVISALDAYRLGKQQ